MQLLLEMRHARVLVAAAVVVLVEELETVVAARVVVGTTATVVTDVRRVVGTTVEVVTRMVDVVEVVSVTGVDTTVGTVTEATDVLTLVDVEIATDAEAEMIVGTPLLMVGNAAESGDDTTLTRVERMVVATTVLVV